MASDCRGLDKNELVLLCQKANQGDAESQFKMGEMYHLSKQGVMRDIIVAIQWYQKAAEQGYAPAQVGLGVIYGIGPIGYDVQNDQMALYWFHKAAKQGNAAALMNLGIHYSNGQGVKRDLSIAKSYFGQSCDKGLQLACNLYRTTIDEGVAIETSCANTLPDKFIELCKKANQGDIQAQLAIGKIFLIGNGVKQNSQIASQWFLKAAEQGNAQAQAAIGFMYQQGDGVKQNSQIGSEWYKKINELDIKWQ